MDAVEGEEEVSQKLTTSFFFFACSLFGLRGIMIVSGQFLSLGDLSQP